MRSLFLLCMVSLAALAGHGQNPAVYGVVKDKASGEPLIGVVVITEGRSGTVTDVDGKYQLSLLPGSHTLTFRMTSYKEEIRNVILIEGEKRQIDIAMESAAEQLGIVVVSAGKYEQNLSEVTVSMEVLQPSLIRDKNIVSIEEGLQQTPGVAIVDDEPQIRSGSGYSFGAGSRVQVLVDDIPVLSGDAGKPSWGFLPVENISQVEVIKGASSVLYGSSALSGVVNFRTAYPTSTPRTRLTLYHGAYSRPASAHARYWNDTPMQSGLLFLHAEKTKAVDLVIGASIQSDDGHLGPIQSEDGSFSSGYSPFTADRYDASYRARITMNLRRNSTKVKGLSYGINGNYSDSESMATLIWENDSAGLYGAYQGSATRTIQQLSTLDPFVNYYRNGARHSLRGRWQSLDNNNDNDQGNFSDVYFGEYQYQQNWDSLGVRGLTSTFGVVMISTEARGELFTGGNPDGRNNAGNQAAYLQLDKKFGKRWNASAGVRYEQFNINDEQEGKPVFRAGLNFQAAKGTWLRGSFGQGYRFPSIAEKFIVTSLGAIRIFPNPDLRSESSDNIEFGIKQGFRIRGFKGFVDIAVFQQRFDNFIEFTFGQWKPVPFDSLSQLTQALGFKSVNTGRARVRGAELSVMGSGNIGSLKLDLLAGYTYTLPVSLTPQDVYAETLPQPNSLLIESFAQASFQNTSSDPSGNILKYRMQHLVRVDAGITWRKLTAGASFRSNSHMQNIDSAFEELEEQLPTIFNPGIRRWRSDNTKGDFVVDARAGFQFNAKHKAALVVSNVFNREYAIRPLAIEEGRLFVIQYTFTLGE
ncbi:MAG: TonB-dependent receptor [Flavobacteriales bacterium]